MLQIADIYTLTGRRKYLTITLYSTYMQEEIQSIRRLGNMTLFPDFYYVVSMLFASDKRKKKKTAPS